MLSLVAVDCCRAPSHNSSAEMQIARQRPKSHSLWSSMIILILITLILWHGMATYPCQFFLRSAASFYLLELTVEHVGTLTGHWMPGSHHEPKATATGRYVVGCTAGNGQYWTSGWDHRKLAKLNGIIILIIKIGRMRAYSCQHLSAAVSILNLVEPVMCKDTHAQSRKAIYISSVKCGMAVRRWQASSQCARQIVLRTKQRQEAKVAKLAKFDSFPPLWVIVFLFEPHEDSASDVYIISTNTWHQIIHNTSHHWPSLPSLTPWFSKEVLSECSKHHTVQANRQVRQVVVEEEEEEDLDALLADLFVPSWGRFQGQAFQDLFVWDLDILMTSWWHLDDLDSMRFLDLNQPQMTDI